MRGYADAATPAARDTAPNPGAEAEAPAVPAFSADEVRQPLGLVLAFEVR